MQLHFPDLCLNRLVVAHTELDDTKSKSTTTLLATEALKAECVTQYSPNAGITHLFA